MCSMNFFFTYPRLYTDGVFKFKECCREKAKNIQMNGRLDECKTKVTSMIVEAASENIPKTVMTANRKMPQWWTESVV